MQINATTKDLSSIFKLVSEISIPRYQRNYAWKESNVEAFFLDVTEIQPKQDHFFGPIVILEDQKNDSAEVVDGQQRLTTAVILLCIIRDKIATFTNSTCQINLTSVALDSMINPVLFKDDMTGRRFVPSFQIKEVFDQFIVTAPSEHRHKFSNSSPSTPKERENSKALAKAHNRLQKSLEGWLDTGTKDEENQKQRLYRLILNLINNSQFLVMSIANENDAYVLFETLNDRSLRLSPSDLLKGFTLRVASAEDGMTLEKAADKWDSAVSRLGQSNFTKFLNHYLLATQDKKIGSPAIYKTFTEIVSGYGPGGSLRNLDEISISTKYYAKVLNNTTTNDKDLDRCIRDLNLFSETHRILLLRLFQMKYPVEEILKTAKAIEILAFRWILTGENSQILKDFFQSQAQLLASDGDQGALDAVIANLQAKTPKDEVVLAKLTTSKASKDLQFYVLKKIIYAYKGFSQEVTYDQKTLHVEHLAPVSPSKQSQSWFTDVAPKKPSNAAETSYAEAVQMWGNLTLLEFEINTSVKNNNWKEKIEPKNSDNQGIGDSAIQMTLALKDFKNWNLSLIKERTLWIAASMVELSRVSNFNEKVVIKPFASGQTTLQPQ